MADRVWTVGTVNVTSFTNIKPIHISHSKNTIYNKNKTRQTKTGFQLWGCCRRIHHYSSTTAVGSLCVWRSRWLRFLLQPSKEQSKCRQAEDVPPTKTNVLPLRNLIRSLWNRLKDCFISSEHVDAWWHYAVMHFFNTLRPRQNGRHFPDAIFKWIFLNENVWISIKKKSLKFVSRGPISNIPALVQIMAWHRPGDKPLSEPMMVKLLTHICVTRPQWVNDDGFKVSFKFQTEYLSIIQIFSIGSGNGLASNARAGHFLKEKTIHDHHLKANLVPEWIFASPVQNELIVLTTSVIYRSQTKEFLGQ